MSLSAVSCFNLLHSVIVRMLVKPQQRRCRQTVTRPNKIQHPNICFTTKKKRKKVKKNPAVIVLSRVRQSCLLLSLQAEILPYVTSLRTHCCQILHQQPKYTLIGVWGASALTEHHVDFLTAEHKSFLSSFFFFWLRLTLSFLAATCLSLAQILDYSYQHRLIVAQNLFAKSPATFMTSSPTGCYSGKLRKCLI